MQALQAALLVLINDPVAIGLLIAGVAVIIGYHGLRWQERIDKQRKS